jgi:predicted DCC family thiol-disulfide oxidoreductase YuxK
MPDHSNHAVVVFDGECALCDGAVSFILDHDPSGYFRFAARQSEAGSSLLRAHGLALEGLGTMVLVEGGEAHLRSEAALRIARRLEAPWSLLALGRVVPRALRDAVYDVVSRNRQRMSRSMGACPAPTPERRARMLT